jgi:hypothetical protein
MPGERALRSTLLWSAFLLVSLLAAPISLFAQQATEPAQQAPPSAAAQAPSQPAAPLPDHPQPSTPEKKPQVHRFWDQTNCWLFAGVLGARYLDFASTLNARRRGLDEALLTNDIVDNHPAFAAIEFAGAATSVGVSYLFHRAGHHSLERWTSIVHIGVTVFGAGRNYLLKTPHRMPTGTTGGTAE